MKRRYYSMKEDIIRVQNDTLLAISAAEDSRALDEARVASLGKKGALTALSMGMKDVPQEQKGEVGALLNAARTEITAALEQKQQALEEAADRAALDIACAIFANWWLASLDFAA